MIKPNDTIVAYYTQSGIRHRATSGGIGSGIIKELFKKGFIKSAISYDYQQETLQYVPKIIFKEEDYTISGSIYHEIKLVNFITKHINQIQSPFACFALPCQITPIKKILDKYNIKAYLIELTCSSQQSFAATEFLIQKSNTSFEEVSNIRYRGGGWPGGTTLRLKNGTNLFFENNHSMWTQIFHSHLFIMPRCFFCTPTRNTESDIILADPWMIDQPQKEKEGRSLCLIKTEKIASLLNDMSKESLIMYETKKLTDFYHSQMGTIIRKRFNLKHKRLTKFTKHLLNDKFYRKFVLSSKLTFNLHCFIYKNVFRVLHKIDQI